jgi:hypothetical protein
MLAARSRGETRRGESLEEKTWEMPCEDVTRLREPVTEALALEIKRTGKRSRAKSDL